MLNDNVNRDNGILKPRKETGSNVQLPKQSI